MHFDEFLQYLVDPVRTEELNEHWARFAKLCRPCSIKYDFVGKYETINEDADNILRSVGAGHKVRLWFLLLLLLFLLYYITRQDIPVLWKVVHCGEIFLN